MPHVPVSNESSHHPALSFGTLNEDEMSCRCVFALSNRFKSHPDVGDMIGGACKHGCVGRNLNSCLRCRWCLALLQSVWGCIWQLVRRLLLGFACDPFDGVTLKVHTSNSGVFVGYHM